MKNLFLILFSIFTIQTSWAQSGLLGSENSALRGFFEKQKPLSETEILERSRSGRHGGNEGGNGGTTKAIEFISIAKLIGKMMGPEEEKIMKEHAPQGREASKEKFIEEVQYVRVVARLAESMRLRGEIVDAINFPQQKLIHINGDYWMGFDILQKTQLALHEYFGIMGVEINKYDISIKFANFIRRVVVAIESNRSTVNIVRNLFYGRCEESMSLSDNARECVSSEASEQLLKCAKELALRRCRTTKRTGACEFVEEKISVYADHQNLGARSCQAEAVYK